MSSYTTTGNIGIGNINPTTQISVNGDLEVREGNIRMIDFNGAETMRITSNGETIVTAPDGRRYINGLLEQPTEEDRRLEQRRLMTQAINEHDDRARDAQQRLEDEMGAQLAAANERVAERQLSLLENIELGTLDSNIISRMQLLAGIKTTKQQIQQLETEIEQLRVEVNQEEQEAQPENVHLSLWNKIKNTGIKLSRTFTNRSRRRIGALPMSISARLEAVKQSQEL
jgi:capsule polysaccharide export protein KpsE/RkpR